MLEKLEGIRAWNIPTARNQGSYFIYLLDIS